MTINLKPEDEKLIQKRLQGGGFSDVQEVIHHALQVQDAGEAWLELHKQEVSEKIERAIDQADRGEGMSAEQSRAWLEAKKAAWRAEQRR